MARATGAVPRHAKKKKYFRAARGYFGGRSKLWRIAKNAVERGWVYSYRDRKQRKREFRRLWIILNSWKVILFPCDELVEIEEHPAHADPSCGFGGIGPFERSEGVAIFGRADRLDRNGIRPSMDQLHLENPI